MPRTVKYLDLISPTVTGRNARNSTARRPTTPIPLHSSSSGKRSPPPTTNAAAKSDCGMYDTQTDCRLNHDCRWSMHAERCVGVGGGSGGGARRPASGKKKPTKK